MANYFYVKAGLGTRTSDTDKTSAETGAFGDSGLEAADVYDNFGVLDGLTTIPTDGDFVMVSDAHTKAYASGGVNFNATGSVAGAGLQIISVDDSNANQYSPGASEEITGGNEDYIFTYTTAIFGVILKAEDNVAQLSQFANFSAQDSTIRVKGGSDIGVSLAGTNCRAHLINVTIDCGDGFSDPLSVHEGTLIWDGGSLTGSIPDNLFGLLATSEDAHVELTGVDLSLSTGQLMSSLTATGRGCLFRLNHCTLNSSATLYGTLSKPNHRFEMYNCDDTSGALHRFEIADGTGRAINNDSIYVTATEGWYGGSDKSSIAVTTEALCSEALPFIFELPAQYVDLSSGSSDKIEIELWSETTLTAGDICAFLVYPDGTDPEIPHWISSGPSVGAGNYGHDPLSTAAINKSAAGAGSANLGASDWTGESGTPLYYTLELDTSSDAGAASAVGVRIEVYKASITDPIYIHPLFTLS